MLPILVVVLAFQGPRINPAWTKVDSAAHTVELTLIAGMNGVNGGMSFNGATNGALTVSVPMGWTVRLKFENADQMLPHSAVVVPAAATVPVAPPAAAFAHASTHRVPQGLPADAREVVTFVPDRAGSYMILCGVPGHGLAGMWLKLEVTETPGRIGFEVTPH